MSETIKFDFPLLLTDCSALGTRAGILSESGWSTYGHYSGEVSAVLFDAVKDILARCQLKMRDIQGFVHCEGPGSTLGIRINAMAIRSWNSLNETIRPVYAYRSLPAAGLLALETGLAKPPMAIFSDLRKGTWNACRLDNALDEPPIEVVDTQALPEWPPSRFFIRQRLYSPGMPPDTPEMEYDLEALGQSKAFRKLFKRVEKPAVYQTRTTHFKKWVPQRHR